MEQKRKGVDLPPIGVKFHGYEMFQELPNLSQKIKANILRRPTKWNNKNADYIFSYGGKITELILNEIKVPDVRIWNFTSGIDENWLSKDVITINSTVKFVFVGRNEVRKGINELNIVINNLLPNYEFQFHFIGPIPESEKISNSNIVYHGELNSKNEICDVLDKMNVLVCPSHSEGMPNVILEGMSRGLAVIATNVGAIEMLVDNSNGRLIQPMNIKELENAIVNLLEIDKVCLEQMCEESKNKVSNDYLWTNLIQKIAERINTSIR
jgi:glycosyltransferase involved in cell wall biosynthesis